MRVLVTGGAGAIGGNLAAALLREGHEVLVFDDLSSGRLDLVPHGASFFQGSVTSEKHLAKAFEFRPDHVLHLAALFANQNSVDHPVRDLEVNGRGTLHVLEAAERAGVGKLLFASSSCVYGDKPLMREEDAVFNPDTPYAMTKLLGERYCRFWAEQRDLPNVIVRLFNTYGPGEYPGPYRNVIPNLLRIAMRGEPLPITGTGEETRDFNFVEDAVAGMLAALRTRTGPSDVFNLASGHETRILDLAERINELTGNRAGLVWRPRRSWDRVLRRRADIAKAEALLGYRPAVPLEEGLRRTQAWLAPRLPEVAP